MKRSQLGQWSPRVPTASFIENHLSIVFFFEVDCDDQQVATHDGPERFKTIFDRTTQWFVAVVGLAVMCDPIRKHSIEVKVSVRNPRPDPLGRGRAWRLRDLRRLIRFGVLFEGLWWFEVLEARADSLSPADRRWLEDYWYRLGDGLWPWKGTA